MDMNAGVEEEKWNDFLKKRNSSWDVTNWVIYTNNTSDKLHWERRRMHNAYSRKLAFKYKRTVEWGMAMPLSTFLFCNIKFSIRWVLAYTQTWEVSICVCVCDENLIFVTETMQRWVEENIEVWKKQREIFWTTNKLNGVYCYCYLIASFVMT